VAYVLSQEAVAWLRAAEEEGVVLPGPVQEAREQLDAIEADLAALPVAAERTPSAASLMVAGMPAAKAQAEAEKLEDKAAKAAEIRRRAQEVRDVARLRVERAVAAHREELMVGLRPLVTALVEECRPAAAQLRAYAPAYFSADLLGSGTPEDLAAYQAASVIEARLGRLIAAYRASFKAATAPTNPHRPIADVRDVAQVHQWWENPELVSNPALNGTKLSRRGQPVPIQPTALGVSSEPAEAGFRMALPSELAAIFHDQNPLAPRHRGVRSI
jgi:hypothetical protein